LSDTTIGCFIRLFFWIAALHHPRHLVGGAPGPGRATTISTGLVGSQAAIAGRARQHGRHRGHGCHDLSHVFLPYVARLHPGVTGHVFTARHCAD
jgi:hypothetical protein